MSGSEWEYLEAALVMKFGWVIGLSCWQLLIRMGMSFFNRQLQSFLETALPADKLWIQSVLDNRWYRVTWFLVNLLVSVKLPEVARKALPASATGDTPAP